MQYSITLQAGVEKRQDFGGTTLVILDTGAAPAVDMKVEIAGFAVEELRAVKKGLNLRAPGFTGAKFLAAVDCTLQVVVSSADISVNYTDGATVQAQIIGQPVAVVPDRGAPANPVYVSGITYTDAPATAITDNAAVAVTSARTALLAASDTRKAARFTNIGTDDVAIGTTGITWAKRCVILQPGDTWVEDRAAYLAWAPITEAGKSASITVQEVTA